jgi:cellulose synthase/poly-beta-1,6-N-acetylglucosamine synthase-like glycosyltransferase
MVKNKIRLRGLSRLGIPVPLTGTGMGFPWNAIANVQLATGDIVEDMRLGIELSIHGMGAGYCDDARVYSYFPTSEEAGKNQRERWEHGHISTLKQFSPRLFTHAIRNGSIEALGIMFDLIIPPLSLLVMIIAALWSLLVITAIATGYWQYCYWSSLFLVLIITAIVSIWLTHGRRILSAKELLHIPIYIVSKIAIYVDYIVRKQTKWIKTDRH